MRVSFLSVYLSTMRDIDMSLKSNNNKLLSLTACTCKPPRSSLNLRLERLGKPRPQTLKCLHSRLLRAKVLQPQDAGCFGAVLREIGRALLRAWVPDWDVSFAGGGEGVVYEYITSGESVFVSRALQGEGEERERKRKEKGKERKRRTHRYPATRTRPD